MSTSLQPLSQETLLTLEEFQKLAGILESIQAGSRKLREATKEIYGTMMQNFNDELKKKEDELMEVKALLTEKNFQTPTTTTKIQEK